MLLAFFKRQYWLSIVLSAISGIHLFGQTWFFGSSASMPVGTMRLAPMKSSDQKYLKVPLHAPEDLENYEFLSQVGGVAFQGIAQPSSGFLTDSFSLVYYAGNSDGERLLVISGTDTMIAPVFDWQLIPLIRFADTEYHSCVSLFGPRSVSSNFKTKTHHVVYHPSFHNTLLGVRLLHADILLLNLSEFWQVPVFQAKIGAEKVAIMGAGEPAPAENWEEAASDIRAALFGDSTGMILFSMLFSQPYDSYVLTDYGEQITISREGNRLVLSGDPYYHFWKADYEHQKWIQKVKGSTTYSYTQPGVIVLEHINKAMKEQRSQLRAFNPFVYDAARNTMRYSAFFRYAKQRSLSNWKQLVAAVEKVVVKPVVQTPTSWSPQ